MGIIQVVGPDSGRSYSINISGETPTDTEQARINQYVAQQEVRYSQFKARYQPEEEEEAPEESLPVEDEEDTALGGFARGVGRGFVGSFAQLPQGIVGLGEAAMGRAAGSTRAGQIAQGVTESGLEATEYLFGPSDGEVSDKFGEAVGSIASFFVPGTLAAKGAKGLGALAKGQRRAAVAGGAGFGAGLGASDQINRIAENIASGNEVDDDANRLAVLFGSAVGATEVFTGPVTGRVTRAYLEVMKKVPPNKRKLAAESFAKRIRNAALRGTGEGLQEAVAGATQDLIEKELYNPNQEIGESAAEEFAYGGAAGATLDFLLSGLRNRAVKPVIAEIEAREKEEKLIQSEAQLNEDQAEEVARNTEELQRVNNVLAAPEEVLALPAPDGDERTFPTPSITDGLDVQSEYSILAQTAKETTRPLMPIKIGTLPFQERQAVQAARKVQGLETTGEVTVDELRRIVGDDAATREVKKQKPVTSGDARYLPVQNKPFTQEQLDIVTQEIRGADTATAPKVTQALRKAGATNKEGRVPQSTTYAMLDELSNRGYIRKIGTTPKGRAKYAVEPDVSAGTATARVGAGTEAEKSAYVRTINDIEKRIEGLKKDRLGALEQARKVEQDLRLDLKEVERPNARQRADAAREFKLSAEEIESDISKAQQNLYEVRERLESGTTSRAFPTTESPKKILSEELVGTDGIIQPSQTGRADALLRTVENYNNSIAQKEANLKALEKQTKKVKLPASEVQVINDIKEDIERSKRIRDAAQSRLDRPTDSVPTENPSVDASRANKTSRQATAAKRSIPFTEKQNNVIGALQKRLKNLGLSDVNLVAQRLVNPEGAAQGQLTEGFFDNSGGNRVIALSMEIIDPNKSAQEQFNVLRGVMNHEVIHALRDLGLFTDAEYNILVKAASKRKYVAIKDGKPVEREYTYLDRAQRMYQKALDDGQYTQEMIEEEAVAEMFRDFADDKIKVIGKPRTLFQRIKDFFLGIRKANEDVGFKTIEDIFQGIRSGQIGSRERIQQEAEPETDNVQQQSRRFSQRTFFPRLDMAPEGTPNNHKLPSQLLIQGDGSQPIVKITQSYGPANREDNNSAIEQIINNNPDAMTSVAGWKKAMQEGLGGDYLPAPPLVAIEYSQSPERMAEKLKQLTPELRKGVDEGFKYVDQIRNIYQSGQANPRMTMDLFMWGILSRGAGPVQQEGAFIDTIDGAYPALEKATRQPLTDDDIDMWMTSIAPAIPEGSPGKSVTMNVNAAGRLAKSMSQFVEGTNRTVLDIMHEGLSDPNMSAADLREFFMTYADAAGIDNKVVSFIFLVAGKDDVLVMDRIQGRHLWDDGRYGGANIYDGIGPNKEGLSGIVRGPRGNLVTRILENGMRKNVKRAYELAGRPQDASLGRWHWETWVIEGEQVVSHGTLQAIINGSPIGTSVTEGKTDTFSSGMTYKRGKNAAVVEYPLSDGSVVYMSPQRFQEFTRVLSGEASKTKNKTYTQEKSKTKVFKKYGPFVNDPEGRVFKVTDRADIPWYTRPEVDRQALDNLAREYENAEPDGGISTSDARARRSQDASRRGNTDRRYSLGFISEPSRNVTQRDGRMVAGRVDFRERKLKPVAKYGDDSRPVYEIADPTVFTEMIQAAKRELGPLGPQVTDYTEMGDSYSGKRLFLFDNGYSGFALNGNDIISVFSVPGPAPKGAVKTLMPIAIEQGGERLDAFNTFLPYVYSKTGFRAVAKLPFNREYAPEGWNYSYYAQSFPKTNGEPEVVFMVYDPDNASKDTTVLIDDYDVGSELQEKALRQRGRDESENELSAEDQLPSDVKEAVRRVIDEGSIQQPSKRMFSLGAPTDPNQIIAAPIKNKDGTTSPIYGSVMDDGQLTPVILRAGNHRDLDDGTALGAGLYHIQQRGHDREIMRFSKYNNVTQAIYDTLRRYKDQGYDDGPDLFVSPQGRDRLVMEWKNNIPYSAPPMNLVLEKKPLGKGSIYEVVTFYPDLEKKDRAVVAGKKRYSLGASADSAQYFNDETIQRAASQSDGSREILSKMPIADFLSAAETADAVPTKTNQIRMLLAQGKKFNSVPFLYVRNDGNGLGTVVGHEGRHRARALAALGLQDLPVLIVSQGGQGPSIRWGRQNDPNDRDYVDPSQRPRVLIGENGDQVPMPRTIIDSPEEIPAYFDTLGEEGALLEFPDIGQAVDRYVYDNDRAAINQALRSPNYAEYRRIMQLALNKEYPDGNIQVQRITGYADPFAEKSSQNFSIPTNDVLFVGNPSERELVVRQGDSFSSVSLPPQEKRPVRFSLGATAAQPQGPTEKQIKQKEYAITYANTANFLGKALSFVVPADRAQMIADDILVKFQDRMLPVGRMLQELSEKRLNIVDAFDTYLKEEIYHRKVANEIEERQNTIYKAATDSLKQVNVDQKRIDQLKVQSNFFKMALEYAGNTRMALADAYLYASHAKERNAYIQQNKDINNSKGSGMSDAEADAILSWFTRLNTANQKAFRDFDAAIKRVVEDTNNVRVYGGLIPRSFTETEDGDGSVVNRTDYESYVPLRGKYDPEGEADTFSGAPTGGLLGVRGREDRIAKGRTEDAGYAIDILATTLNQNQNAVIRAEKNLVGQSFIKLFQDKPEETQSYGRVLDTLPTIRVQGKDKQGNPIMRNKANLQAVINDKSIFVAKVDGKDTFVKLYDPRIAQAMNGFTGLGSESQKTVYKAMAKVNRYLSSINTSLNPEFVITNAIRDIQTGLVNVNQFDEKAITLEVLSGTRKAIKGIGASIFKNDNSSEWAKIYQDFVKAGGKNATNQVSTVAEQMENLQGLLNEVGNAGVAGKKQLATNGIKKVFQTIENANTVAENAIRVSVFNSLRKRNFSPERAAQAAANVTVNFSKGGEYKAIANAFYLFYNASLQGSFAILNAATRSKKVQKILGGVAAFGLLQDYLNAAFSPEDEDGQLIYDKIPEYIKEHNIILMDYFGILPIERGYFAIPMPYGLNIPHNYGRVASSIVRGGMTAGDGANSIFGTTLNTISPIGDIWQTAEGKRGPLLFDALAPTIADPIIDIYKNEDFSGKEIYKEGFPGDDTPRSQLYWSTTSPLFVNISDFLNEFTGGSKVTSGMIDWSPDVLEYWSDTAFGGIGRFTERVGMLPFQDYVDEGTVVEDVVNQIPFARKIFGSITERQDLGVYFNKKDQVEEALREIKYSQETRDPARLQRMKVKYADEIPYIGLIRNIERARRRISRRIKLVEANTQISDARKEEIIKQLREQNNNLILMATRRMANL